MVPGLELVRTVAHRLLAEGLRILVEGFRQRSETGIADLDGEHGVGLVEVHGEFVVVDDRQAFKLLVTLEVVGILQLVVALDGGEEGGALLRVLRIGGIAPRLGEGLGRHRSAVGELPTLLELDGVLGGIRIGFDGLCHFVGSIALGIEGNQAGEQQIDRLTAAGLIGVARDKRVLWLGIVSRDDVAAIGGGIIGSAAAAEQHAQRAGRGSESQSLLLHRIILLFVM